MTKALLKALAFAAEKNIARSNNTACFGLSYQPKAPANIKKFKGNTAQLTPHCHKKSDIS